MSTFSIKRTSSANPDFHLLIKQLDADLRERYQEQMDQYDEHNIIAPIDTVVIAYNDTEAVACGCFKAYDQQSVEVKRMFVHKNSRGQGLSKKILNELEKWALECGTDNIVLETGSRQEEAIGLYLSSGYREIPKYGPYIDLPDSICFKKNITDKH
jgi:putative acetyltransferase